MKRLKIPLLALLAAIFFPFLLKAQNLIVNEFVFAPNGGEAEWIELWNRSSLPVSLRDWKIMDATRNIVVITNGDAVVDAGGYILLASSEPIADRWRQLPCPVIVVSGFPALNNSGDEIVLCDPSNAVVDSIRYESSWNPKRSASVERRRPTIPFIHGNFGPALTPDDGTPGRRNSQTPDDFDLSVHGIQKSVNGISILVKNTGLEIPVNAGLLCGCDADSDGEIGPGDPSATTAFQPPLPEDSISVDVSLACADAPILRAVLIVPGDTNPSNDTIEVRSTLPIGVNRVFFNEIMAAPLSGRAEWVELFNQSARPISLAGCSLAGATGSDGSRSRVMLPPDLSPLSPEGYLLIASDSSVYTDWPELSSLQNCVVAILNRTSLGLGNSGDELLFIDAGGEIADSLVYSEKWHHPHVSGIVGRSLELIHPDLRPQGAAAWTTSPHPSGGTPGRRNGAYSNAASLGAGSEQSLNCTPNPFSPDGDGFEDHCVIRWRLPAAVSLLRMRIFDVEGRCVRTLLNSVPSGREGMTVWQGLDDAGRRVRIGLYVVLVEALDAASNAVATGKAVVAVATKL